MARTFTIAEILTEKQIADLFAIYKKEGTNHHKAMMEYIENRYDGGQFGSVWNTRREALLLHGYGYIDTVRVFAEVPVGKKGKK